MTPPQLEHFGPDEFREWFDRMSPRLLVLLDVFRHRVGRAVRISAHPAALGRRLGPLERSEHNLDRWGEVLAADVFVDGVYGRRLAGHVIREAKAAGFTGIGLYTDTRNNDGLLQPMLHLGCRPTRKMGEPATWGRIDGGYVSLADALNHLERAEQ